MNNSERENGNCAHEDVLAATLFGLVSDIQLAGRETVVDLSVASQSCLVDRYIAECEKALNVVTTCTPEDGKKKKKLDAGKRSVRSVTRSFLPMVSNSFRFVSFFFFYRKHFVSPFRSPSDCQEIKTWELTAARPARILPIAAAFYNLDEFLRDKERYGTVCP